MEKALPLIPAKRYFTIGEVSELCGVKPYVLRYWEQEFTQLKPMKRRGNRRYYQHHEVLLIRRIRELLYDQGFTISGARNQLIDPLGSRTQPGVGSPVNGADTQFDPDIEFATEAQGNGKLRVPVGAAQTLAPRASGTSAGGQAMAVSSKNAVASAAVTASFGSAPLAAGHLREELLSIRDLLSP